MNASHTPSSASFGFLALPIVVATDSFDAGLAARVAKNGRGRHKRVLPLNGDGPQRTCVGGTYDWPLSIKNSFASLPTGPVPVEAVTERYDPLDVP